MMYLLTMTYSDSDWNPHTVNLGLFDSSEKANSAKAEFIEKWGHMYCDYSIYVISLKCNKKYFGENPKCIQKRRKAKDKIVPEFYNGNEENFRYDEAHRLIMPYILGI